MEVREKVRKGKVYGGGRSRRGEGLGEGCLINLKREQRPFHNANETISLARDTERGMER